MVCSPCSVSPLDAPNAVAEAYQSDFTGVEAVIIKQGCRFPVTDDTANVAAFANILNEAPELKTTVFGHKKNISIV